MSLAEINSGEVFLKGDDEMEDAIEDYLEYQSFMKANLPASLLHSQSGSTAVSGPSTPAPSSTTTISTSVIQVFFIY